MKLPSDINRALLHDSEAVPMDSFGSVSSRVPYGVKRLAALAELLEANPETRGATQLYIAELIGKAQRQVGGSMSLYTTFANRAADISEATLLCLPEQTRDALTRLRDIARKMPVPCPDAMLMAHSLTVGGALCNLIANMSGEPEKRKATPHEVYRELAGRHHPDKGGDSAIMAAVNKLYRAVKGTGGEGVPVAKNETGTDRGPSLSQK